MKTELKLYPFIIAILIVVAVPLFYALQTGQLLSAMIGVMTIFGVIIAIGFNKIDERLNFEKEKQNYAKFFLKEIEDTKPKLENFHKNPQFDIYAMNRIFDNTWSFKHEIVLFNTYNQKILLFDESIMSSIFKYYSNFIQIEELLNKFHELQKTMKIAHPNKDLSYYTIDYLKEIDKFVTKNIELSSKLEEQLITN